MYIIYVYIYNIYIHAVYNIYIYIYTHVYAQHTHTYIYIYINAYYTIEAEGLANTMDLADLEDGMGRDDGDGWWRWTTHQG